MEEPGRHAAAQALKLCSWLDGHGVDLRAPILAHGRLCRFSPGQWVFAEGDDSGGIHVVVEGTLQLYSQAPGGREVLLSQVHHGWAIGQSARFGAGPPLTTAISATHSMTLQLSDHALGTIAAQQPLIWKALASFLYQQLRSVVQVLSEFTALSPEQRIAARLAWLARSQPELRVLHISQQELADMVGLSRKTVNALLSRLDANGLVRRRYGAIEVLDRPGLQAFASAPSARD